MLGLSGILFEENTSQPLKWMYINVFTWRNIYFKEHKNAQILKMTYFVHVLAVYSFYDEVDVVVSIPDIKYWLKQS